MVQARKKRRPPVAELPRRSIAPQLAALAEPPPAGEEWLYEIKYDGYRVLARIDGATSGSSRAAARTGPRSFRGSPAAVAKLGLKRAGSTARSSCSASAESPASRRCRTRSSGARRRRPLFRVRPAVRSAAATSAACRSSSASATLAALIGRQAGPVRFSDHVEARARTRSPRLPHGPRGPDRQARRRHVRERPRPRPGSSSSAGRARSSSSAATPTGGIAGGYRRAARGRARRSGEPALRRPGRHGLRPEPLGELARTLARHAPRRAAVRGREPPAAAPRPRRPLGASRSWSREVAFAGWTDDGACASRPSRACGGTSRRGEVRARRGPAPAAPAPSARAGSRAGRGPTVAGVGISHPDRVI